MNERRETKLSRALSRANRASRNGWIVAGLTLGCLAWVSYTPSKPDCRAYAQRASQRRGLDSKMRREVERSCRVSVVYGPFQWRAEAEQAEDRLNHNPELACASPGAYVARYFDDERWAVFCPQL